VAEEPPPEPEEAAPVASPGATPAHGVSRKELLERLRLRQKQASRHKVTPHHGVGLPEPGGPAGG
jgi:hypothetical protein